MADLSAYVSFSVLLDKSGNTPVITLTDTSAYPTGVPVTVTGVFSVTQPDGINVSGNFTTPDINGATPVLSCQKTLRLASDGNFQNGVYTITYTVQATGYDATVLTQAFNLVYEPAKPVITDLTNPFTPTIQVIDSADTLYSVQGFATPTVTRTWNASISFIGNVIQTLTSSAVLFDLIFNSLYYDADYNITLQSVATYVSTAYSWLSLKDIYNDGIQLSVYAPPTLAQLRASLVAMKTAINNGTYCGGGCGCGCTDYAPYNLAQNIFDAFVQNGQASDNISTLYPSIVQLENLFNCSAINKQVHTYQPLGVYDFGASSGGGGGVSRPPIQFTVGGAMPHAPADGDTSYINDDLRFITSYAVFSQADGNYLRTGTDITINASGGWSWIGGRTFVKDEQYTLVF